MISVLEAMPQVDEVGSKNCKGVKSYDCVRVGKVSSSDKLQSVQVLNLCSYNAATVALRKGKLIWYFCP